MLVGYLGSLYYRHIKKLKTNEGNSLLRKSWILTQRTGLKLSALQRNSASSNGVDGLATRVGNLGIDLQEQMTNANAVMYAESPVVRAVIVCFGLSWV